MAKIQQTLFFFFSSRRVQKVAWQLFPFIPGGTRGSRAAGQKPEQLADRYPDKGSEVRAVKRLLTSHFICQTFISLFMVQRTPSALAMAHTWA